ncbi:hypothetical protein DACRYDRAFT_21898 [Dacryopinax primogenitus]|uniref:Uncharacterized protein n=1 Tax=Dacryopinax primogenitus (strain DJM 731) TaxID=1858805 RepID=M5G8F2_DACPD|nr:uncharacterized protein DACRYDRAFT_21898 [Dacryopinax primogenitus]EJU02132.1 hypothetical protein DACRYDRAFT_21898 [Dacryopinax primogenitus]
MEFTSSKALEFPYYAQAFFHPMSPVTQCIYGTVDGTYTRVKDCGKRTCSNSDNWDPEAKSTQSPPKK